MKLLLAIFLSGLSGFIALSYEILWVRAYSFFGGGRPPVFGLVLGFYLTGIAGGAFIARRWCRGAAGEDRHRQLQTIAVFVFLANVFGFLLVPGVAEIGHRLAAASFSLTVTFLVTLVPLTIVAALLGTGLPLISHFGVAPDERAGAQLSYIYLGNIIGSAAGSLVTGFWLMDLWPMAGIATFLALLGIAFGAGITHLSGTGGQRRFLSLGVLSVGAIVIVLVAPVIYAGVYEKLQLKEDYVPGYRFSHSVENRSGIITVDSLGRIFGGGLYDGMFSTDPIADRNIIVRAYALAALHPAPSDVLMIGLSSGSWAQVIASHPSVQRLVVVEINPGYLELIPQFSAVASLLTNPKVEIVIDDGRRWLLRNPDRFDMIVSNTTWHWRAHVTNLLSREFLELVRAHLEEGGIFYYNTTDSADAQRTAAAVFPFAWRFTTAMAVSDEPIRLDRARWRRVLARYTIDGKPVFDPARDDHRARLDEITGADEQWEDRESVLRRTGSAVIITDDNMASEWGPRHWGRTRLP